MRNRKSISLILLVWLSVGQSFPTNELVSEDKKPASSSTEDPSESNGKPESPETAPDAQVHKLTVTDKWSVLVNPSRPRAGVVAISPKSPIQNVNDFQFKGPQTGHPFCLGDFSEDGQFAMTNGIINVVEGKNALLNLAVADEFELEGMIELQGLGGWLMLLGWNQGHGYSLSNVTLKDSGSPWFLCEYRGGEALIPTNNEVKQLQWNGTKAFRMTVQHKQLTVLVDKLAVLENYALDNYTAGQLMIGTYDTRYGPRPLKIHSLRIRSPGDDSKPGKSK